MLSSSIVWRTLLDLVESTYEGVDPNFPGNGGLDCYNFLSLKERAMDTLLYTLIVILVVIPVVRRTLNVPTNLPSFKNVEATKVVGTRRLLLISLCMALGVELGYKLSTKQLIYILNPCHIITLMQIYLLSCEPSKTALIVFRVHVHLLFGAFLAILFPVVNVRILPCEVAIYWIQHVLIFFVIPPYLMSCGGQYTPEPLRDLSWPLLTLVFFSSHMYYVLQGIGMLTLVNLNSMLCPAVSDPFYGPYYRWFAMVHQTLLTIFFGKVYTFIVQSIQGLCDSFKAVVKKSL